MSRSRNELFSRLFLESRSALRRYVRRLVGSPETADEIVQEAFLRAYERLRNDEAPTAYLYSIARNLAQDHQRHERIAQCENLGDCDLSNVLVQEDTLEADLLAEERSQFLKEAIETLPPQCRMTFSLRVFHGLSHAEIAEKLGITTKTVEFHIARGIRDTHTFFRRKYAHKEVRSSHE